MKGILASVLRSPIDCTNNGVTSKHNDFYLVGENVAKKFETNDSKPILKLVKRVLWGEVVYHAEPINKDFDGVGYMFGGNYITVSREEAPTKHPIPVHDRTETPREYKSYSN